MPARNLTTQSPLRVWKAAEGRLGNHPYEGGGTTKFEKLTSRSDLTAELVISATNEPVSREKKHTLAAGPNGIPQMPIVNLIRQRAI